MSSHVKFKSDDGKTQVVIPRDSLALRRHEGYEKKVIWTAWEIGSTNVFWVITAETYEDLMTRLFEG